MPKTKRLTDLLILSSLLVLHSTPLHAERLSDWILAQPHDADSYPLGLSWRVPGEKIAQNELYFDLLQALTSEQQIKAGPEARERLRKWISSLPVTGRVPVAVADARWLQANPASDPVISADDTVVLPKRPETVTVLTADGKLCRVKHAVNRFAMDYVQQCSANSPVDWVYVAQPDGTTQRFGVALWNGEKQDPPAPGAWIWAPPRDEGWSDKFSGKLIAFLATQGPAPDVDRTQLKVEETFRGVAAVQAALPAPAATIFGSDNLPVTANDWGEAGLLQTPGARMRPAGDFNFTLTRVYPYTFGNVFAQPFDWFEVGFRYTNISNRLYGPAIAGSQAYKDKSIDVKFKLIDESAYKPQLAVGLRDIAGTGLFSGEYLVANKRTGPLDWSLGLGWGYVGGRGNVTNPFAAISQAYKTRNQTIVGQGGDFGISSYFRGPASLFGGVQYQTPWDPLILKLEYDGNNYKKEPLGNVLPQNSPLNVGAVYRLSKSVDLTAGLERGNTAMISLTLHAPLDKLTAPKLDDSPRVPVQAYRPKKAPDWTVTSRDIKEQTQWHVGKIQQHGHELIVTIDDADVVYWRDYLDRATAVLHRDAPDTIDRFSFVYRQHGVIVARHRVDRNAWVAKRTQALPPGDAIDPVIADAPGITSASAVTESRERLYKEDQPVFESKLGVNLNYNVGGPNAFALYQISPIERAKLRLNKDTWVQGAVQLDVLDNFDKFTYTAPSNLPRVRTYLREYMVTSKFTMPYLQLTHVGKISDNQYYSAYGGYLEEMFGGVGGEWLYRPFAGRTALGVDVNAVRQRDFGQNFGFRNYNVLTGHATLYWDTGLDDVLANLSAGRYLAGDVGVTVDFSRVFPNGVRMGAYFTKTNVSAQQFGEGSYDKGVYVSIPFDAMLSKSTGATSNILWKPLTRDGGAKLNRQVALYDLTKARDDRALRYEPAPQPDEYLKPEDLRQRWNPATYGSMTAARIVPQPTAERWTADEDRYEERLRGALNNQQFRNVSVSFGVANTLTVSLDNAHVHPMSRAVGLAARTVLLNSPLETRAIRIKYNGKVSYDFFDLEKLKRYFAGEISPDELKKYVDISWVNPSFREANPLEHLADVDAGNEAPTLTDTVTGTLLQDMHPVDRVARDLKGAAGVAARENWMETGLIGVGVVAASTLLDRRADNFAVNHSQSSWLKTGNAIGNAIPWAAAAGTAMAALASDDPKLSRTSYAASEAAVTSYAAVLGLKYAFGRARPFAGQGSSSFHPFAGSAANGTDGFPSGHTIVAWAIATPFAKEYNAPWLYALAAGTNLARVGSRNHWVSDTVAGSFLGYEIGKIFWKSSEVSGKGEPRIMIHPSGVNLSWDLK